MKFNMKLMAGSFFVVLIVCVCLAASYWQFSRLAQRKDLNAKIERSMAKPPFELNKSVELGDLEYRTVEMTGIFDGDRQVLVVGRFFEGEPGFNVLTPFVLDNGSAIIYVNRGWIPQPLGDSIIDGKSSAADIEPFGGYDQKRNVTGLIRRNEPKRVVGNSHFNDKTSISPRIATDTFIELFDKEQAKKVADFWVQEDFQSIDGKKIAKSSPEKEIFPKQIEKPKLDERNHLSYAIQWLCFAIIAIITWVVILRKSKKVREAV